MSMSPRSGCRDCAEPVKLGADEYFLLGDNPQGGEDSRSSDIGIVKKDDLYGKVWFNTTSGDHFGMCKKVIIYHRQNRMQEGMVCIFSGIRSYDKGRRMMQENIKLIESDHCACRCEGSA